MGSTCFNREKTFLIKHYRFSPKESGYLWLRQQASTPLRPSVLNLNAGFSGHWVHGEEVATFLMRSSPSLCLLLCGWVTKSRRTDRVSTEHGSPEYQGRKKFNVKVMLKYSFQFKLRHRLFYKTNTIQESLPCVLNSQSSDRAGSHSFYRFFQKLSNLVWHSWHHFQSHKLKTLNQMVY